MSAAKLLDQAAFRDAARAGHARSDPVSRPSATVLRVGDAASRVVRFVLSDGSVDRMNDTINPNGWELTAYRRNPTVLFAHDSMAPPIGRMKSVWSDGTRLLGDVEFADSATYDYADVIYRLIVAGFLKAGSVGFIPLEFSFSKDPSRQGGVDFKRTELVEFSITPVPANSNALVEARARGLVSGRDIRRLADEGVTQRRRRAELIAENIRADDARRSDSDFAARLADAHRAHDAFMEQRDRAAAIDAVARWVGW